MNGSRLGADRTLQRYSSDPAAGLAIGTASLFTIAPIVRTHYGWAVGASPCASRSPRAPMLHREEASVNPGPWPGPRSRGRKRVAFHSPAPASSRVI
jgi:hypothetical protein